MKLKSTLLATAISMAAMQPAIAHQNAECGDPRHPLLSVADFDADGVVTGKDIAMMARKLGKKSYFAMYDMNADTMLDAKDTAIAGKQIGLSSTPLDQWLATQYNRFEHFQHISGHATIAAMGYQQFGGPLNGHGVHWLNEAGSLAVAGLGETDQTIAEGLNLVEDGSGIPALFWGQGVVPLFEDPNAPGGLSPLDFPAPNGVWNLHRVQAFGGHPPDFIPGVEENWHTHGGLCVTLQATDSGPEWINNQHMSNAECQALPNLAPLIHPITQQTINAWGNFYMMHAWLFDLNPRGVFANTHPCVSPTAPDEDAINGGREVPIWFQQHGGHS